MTTEILIRSQATEPQGLQQGLLLDDDGSISEQLESCLKHIFSKYCTPTPPTALRAEGPTHALLVPPDGASLTSEALDAWARDTNGTPFSEETKEELVEYLDVTAGGDLTFKGFMQIYQLQTENDEEETWKDLASHGFDRTLRLVRRGGIETSDSQT